MTCFLSLFTQLLIEVSALILSCWSAGLARYCHIFLLSPLPPSAKANSLQMLGILLRSLTVISAAMYVSRHMSTITLFQLGLTKYLLVESISGWAWPDRRGHSYFMGRWCCCVCQASQAVRTKETAWWTGRQPGMSCPWQVFLSWNLASWFFLLFLSGCFFFLISLGMQETLEYLSFSWFYAIYLLTARESINK